MTIRLTKLSNAEYALRDIREATMGDGTLKGASPAGYYTAPGNPPGRWIGSACRLVGGREGGEATSAQVCAASSTSAATPQAGDCSATRGWRPGTKGTRRSPDGT